MIFSLPALAPDIARNIYQRRREPPVYSLASVRREGRAGRITHTFPLTFPRPVALLPRFPRIVGFSIIPSTSRRSVYLTPVGRPIKTSPTVLAHFRGRSVFARLSRSRINYRRPEVLMRPMFKQITITRNRDKKARTVRNTVQQLAGFRVNGEVNAFRDSRSNILEILPTTRAGQFSPNSAYPI